MNNTQIWLKNNEKIWIKGHIISNENNLFTVYDSFLENEKVVSENDFYLANKITNKTNLINLIHLHEPAILNSLKNHYSNDNIYTWTGPILIAINPFKILPIYTNELLDKHCLWGINNNNINPTPHVYSIADYSYRKLCTKNTSQSILISGESGAGKTVSTKIIMKYLTKIGASKETSLNNIESTILDSNPILEAFGNAATIRNNNSSRFGKYIKLIFDKNILTSGCIETYLLELVRLIKQVGNERNFHIFYQLFDGLSDSQLEELHLNRTTTYKIVNPKKVDGINDRIDFSKTCEALKTMKCSNEEINSIWSIVAGVILLGELNNKNIKNNNETIVNICDLLKINQNLLIEKLTTKKIITPSETFIKTLEKNEVLKTKDTVIKILYDQLFKWLVKLINKNINIETNTNNKFIGILDIFGFEVFENNYFEQLCINFTNEILQQQFNKYIFKLEQQEYKAENIDWTVIDYPDNKDCIKLITAKPFSIFTLLDEECTVGDNNDTAYHRKILRHLKDNNRLSFNKKMMAKGLFTICHYAGDVTYNTKNFCFKNKQIMSPELLELIYNSEHPLIKIIADDLKITVSKHSVNKIFQKQLAKLMKLISKTNTHYIRCIKPNDINKSNNFDNKKVVEQLRYAGVLEAIKVARAGYPIRFKKTEFAEDFLPLFNWKIYNIQDINDIMEKILSTTEIKKGEYQIGLTKIFFKKNAFHTIENTKTKLINEKAIKIQSIIRCYLDKTKFKNIILSTIKIQAAIRRLFAIKLYKKLRSNHYAKKITTWWRCYNLKNKFTKTKKSTIKIQTFFRKVQTIKKIIFYCKMWKATTKITSKWRQYYNTKNYLLLKSSTNIIITEWKKWKSKINKKTKNLLILETSNNDNSQYKNLKMTPIAKIKEKPANNINNERINSLENTIVEMQTNFQSMIKSLSEKIDKPSPSPEIINILKEDLKEKDEEISKKNREIIKKNKVIEKTKLIIEKQNSIIEQDEIVKRDMGRKLQDILLELNQAQEEIVRLKKMSSHKKNWFW